MIIGFIGLGIMGAPMCSNIIKKRKNDEVVVYDIDDSNIKEVVALGAKPAESIAEVGKKSDIIITMVPTSDNVREVGKQLIPELGPGKIWIDMSTIDPSTSQEIAKDVAAAGALMLDSPVVKSQPAAVDGTLGIYVGGDKEALLKVNDILLCMGNNLIHMGANGMGLVMKACHNMLVAEIQNGVNELITLAGACGISVDDFATAISYGGGQNFYLDAKAAAIRDGNFQTAFSVRNMHKDVGIAGRLVEEQKLKLPGLSVIADVYKQAVEAGLADEDFSATFKVVSGAIDKEG